MIEYPKIKVAAAHAAPVFLDAARIVDKACSLIAEAAGAGANLIAFPGIVHPGVRGVGRYAGADTWTRPVPRVGGECA